MPKLFIPGQPVPQPRHQVAVRGRYPVAYIPDNHRIHNYKSEIALHAKSMFPEPLQSSFSVQCVFCFERPASHWNKKGLSKNAKRWPRADVDNLLKAVLDSLNDVVWFDDVQVVSVSGLRRWHSDRAVPGYTEVHLEEIDEP